MPITFTCTCGKMLRVKDELAGKSVRCPVCSAAVVVPSAAPAWEVVEDEPPPLPKAKSSPVRATPVVKKIELDDDDEDRPRNRRRDDEDDERPRKRRDDDDDDDDEDRPRKKKKYQSKKVGKEEKHSSFGMEKGIINSGVAGGAIAMFVAVVWFVLGLVNDLIFYYPPILFVIGLIAFVKGLMGGGDD